MEKISRQQNKDWIDCAYDPVFETKKMQGGTNCIVASVSACLPSPFENLVRVLEGPYMLLYVLHTPRGEGKPGRYQSEEFSAEKLSAFLLEFGNYLYSDARFDLWAYSPAERATIVWDRHNLIYAYGPLPRYERVLSELGYGVAFPLIPTPHAHNYREEFDETAARLLKNYLWAYSPLRPEDEQ